ncbi:MAG: M14 family zinc carboxypeptidase [Polyangiaceae bacterium]
MAPRTEGGASKRRRAGGRSFGPACAWWACAPWARALGARALCACVAMAGACSGCEGDRAHATGEGLSGADSGPAASAGTASPGGTGTLAGVGTDRDPGRGPPLADAAARTEVGHVPGALGALTAPALPPRVPDAERPSAKLKPPKGAAAAPWKRLFDTYGKLVDLDPILDDFHREHPKQTEIVTLGATHEGRALKALLIADTPSLARGRPAMLLNGAHHGDEPLSAMIVLDAIEALLAGAGKDPKIDRYLSELAVWCVPLVNRDGFAHFWVDFGAGRKNGRPSERPATAPFASWGVDLNRNYPFRWGAHGEVGSSKTPERRSYRGPEPGSEPETRAIMALSEREHFVGSISYHIGTVALLAPYTIDGVLQPEPNEAWLVAEHVARAIPSVPMFGSRAVPVRKNLYTVDGTDQDHLRHAHGTLALLFESAARSWENPDLARRAVEAIRPSWGALFDRYLDGPSVEGHVRDEAGRPVSARVEVVEVKTHAGEDWRSRCSDGFFGRYLPGTGTFTVRVTPGEGPAVEKTVEVTEGKGRAAIDFVVPASDGASGCGEAGESEKPAKDAAN